MEKSKIDINREYTLSVLTENQLVSVTGTFPTNINVHNYAVNIDGVPWYLTLGTQSSFFFVSIRSQNDVEKAIIPVAAKLELGSVQTLAHQDSEGNWVLNDPPPDKTLETLKCQRYQVFGEIESLPMLTKYSFLPLPVPIRSVPTISGKPEILDLEAELIADATVRIHSVYANGILFVANHPHYLHFPPGVGLDANL